MVQLEVLRKRLDQPDYEQHLLAAVKGRPGMHAVVAAVAVVLPEVLAEIVEQQFAAALARLRVSQHLGEQLAADLLLGDGLALHELLQLLDVLVAVVGDADAFLAVPAGAARLLVVTLDALGDVVVDDEADVRLVDAHAEGDGGHDHPDLLHQELVLVLRARLRIQARVVRQGLDAVDAQQLRHLLHLLAAEAVDDAGLAGVLADELDQVLLRVHLVADLVVEVRAVEGGLEHGRVRDAEVLEDVALHLGRRRGGQGDDGRPPDLVHQRTDAAVLRPEIVPPLRDAVGLVHGVERDLHLAKQRDVLLLGQGLGRHVQELGLAGEQVLAHFVDLLAREGRVEEMRHAGGARLEAADQVHLVLHQGDQRRDDDRSPLHHQGRQLIAQRLAAPGGHQDKGVTPFDQMVDDLFLVRLEGVIAEELLERLMYQRRIRFHGDLV